MNILSITIFFVGFMVSEIPRVSVFGYFPLLGNSLFKLSNPSHIFIICYRPNSSERVSSDCECPVCMCIGVPLIPLPLPSLPPPPPPPSSLPPPSLPPPPSSLPPPPQSLPPSQPLKPSILSSSPSDPPPL